MNPTEPELDQPTLFTHLLPDLISPGQLTGGVAVVIDILRASSTICTSLAAGARTVVPCEQVEIARELQRSMRPEEVLLGGERGGVLIEGFDLGNSPADYTTDRVNNRTVIFTTTNGTRALHHCREAENVAIGSFLNHQALIEWLSEQEKPIHLVCAGTNGSITLEDCLFAGLIAESLEAREQNRASDDATRLCRSHLDSVRQRDPRLLIGLEESRGGRNLTRLGMRSDLQICADINQLENVPLWNRQENRLNNAV